MKLSFLATHIFFASKVIATRVPGIKILGNDITFYEVVLKQVRNTRNLILLTVNILFSSIFPYLSEAF